MGAYQYGTHRVPIHGIPYPQYENPVNLFQRQLQIEQFSFDQSHTRYKNAVTGLIKMGKADQLASSHRNILKWTKTMESALAEQQRIFIKQSLLDTKKIGFYIMACPADELASLSVIHIMRFLLNSFINAKDEEKVGNFSDIQNQDKSLESKMIAAKLF